MSKDPMEMAVEELDAKYGKPELVGTVTHILELSQNDNHDRFAIQILTEDAKRLNIRFTQAALRTLLSLIGDDVSRERPKSN
ncbi:hypothetical protein [Bradyrhizobium sp. CCGUVB14]|uniref:hypothetical protein n=1 Tax=Bradyrhizobium sp. CCGUVB14 TaxID=2949628 RepID=UPI0020B2EC35|nr:hypothetical protein [Bradyrhizobium sp. CCGUVB14]MCP3447552.1 hypothetical protein [Bradyrhizobium sp. CCGUVB14]